MAANFGGKGSCRRLEKSVKCPRCKQRSVYYLGSDVLHGNPCTPAADTEVEHHFECGGEACGHEWSRLV